MCRSFTRIARPSVPDRPSAAAEQGSPSATSRRAHGWLPRPNSRGRGSKHPAWLWGQPSCSTAASRSAAQDGTLHHVRPVADGGNAFDERPAHRWCNAAHGGQLGAERSGSKRRARDGAPKCWPGAIHRRPGTRSSGPALRPAPALRLAFPVVVIGHDQAEPDCDAEKGPPHGRKKCPDGRCRNVPLPAAVEGHSRSPRLTESQR